MVYFDIEATGLKSSGRPRILEVSLATINTQEILNLNHQILEIYSRIGNINAKGF
jgi:uncharacterized protein YprB with RNaseH-like and TPR domain